MPREPREGARWAWYPSRWLLHRADQASDELVVTNSVSERKKVMIARSDALLALPGGVGTCDEIFESWTSRMPLPHRKPLVVLDHQSRIRSTQATSSRKWPGSPTTWSTRWTIVRR